MNVAQPGSAFRESFKNLAAEVIYSAIFALVSILEGIAPTLTLLPRERGAGSKRLAMLVVYRQHWFPAGYVQGKLVGYKNLAPNQSEKVLRRTFVKSTRIHNSGGVRLHTGPGIQPVPERRLPNSYARWQPSTTYR